MVYYPRLGQRLFEPFSKPPEQPCLSLLAYLICWILSNLQIHACLADLTDTNGASP